MLGSNIHFVVQTLPANEDQFQEKLQDLADKSSFNAFTVQNLPRALQELQRYVIKQCVVAPKHMAFFLEDGRVCRLKYSAREVQQGSEAEAEPNTTSDKSSSYNKAGERPAKALRTSSGSPWLVSGNDLLGTSSSTLRRWGTRIGVIRSIASTSSSNATSTTSTSSSSSRSRPRNTTSVIDGSSSLSTSASGGVRLVRTTQLRGRGLHNTALLTGQRVIVPASHVPEELVNQVQGILQGKSRSIIIRELQRTNLDVNLAVNNLLSRDDEDNDDMDDNGSDYMPGDDLLSLLDSGIHGEHGVFIDADSVLPEELLGYTFHRTSRTSASRSGTGAPEGSSGGASNRDLLQDRDPIIRLRSPRFFDPIELSAEEYSESQSKNSVPAKKAKTSSNVESVTLGEKLEWWKDKEEKHLIFAQIGAMQSELVAVNNDGVLCQWKWDKETPYSHQSNHNVSHPRALFLGLEDRKVTHLATCTIRASVMVESGGVATWTDEAVAKYSTALEHPVTASVAPDFAMQIGSERWRSTLGRCLQVCALYSVMFSPTTRELYWWGVLPFAQRRKALEKAQAKLKKSFSAKKTLGSKKSEIELGSQVCLHCGPIFQAGALAIHTRGGEPKVGRLLQSAWDLSDKCTFKILNAKKRKAKPKAEKKGSNEKNQEKGKKESKEKCGTEVQEEKKTEVGDQKETAVAALPSNSERETVLKSTSTSSNLSILLAPPKPQKRKRSPSISMSSQESSSASRPKNQKDDDSADFEDSGEEKEENWNLQDVVFIEDVQTVPVGKVLKMEGDMVVVYFKHGQKSSRLFSEISPTSILKHCRLLRKDDLHVLQNGNPPRVPEFLVKTPRKIPLDASLKIHSVCANENGIKVVEGKPDGSPLTQLDISLSGKITADCPFPTAVEMFFAKNGETEESKERAHQLANICSIQSNCQDFPTVFRDINSTLYPLLRNENCGFRDPRWLNIPPLSALGMGTHYPPVAPDDGLVKTAPKSSKMLVVTALVFKNQLLMPRVVQRDLKGVKDILNGPVPNSDVKKVLGEICDGQRNIIHVAVATTAPTSNQNEKEEDDQQQSRQDKEAKKKDLLYKSLPPSSDSNNGNGQSNKQSTPSVLASVENPVAPLSTSESAPSRIDAGSNNNPMTQSERVDAVNAIASAISVVTRGNSSSDSRPTPSTANPPSRESRNPGTPPVNPFFLPPLFNPSTSSSTNSNTSFSSRFMRDIMQQFAAVLDPQAVSSAGGTLPISATSSVISATASTTSVTSSSSRAGRAVQSLMSEMGIPEEPPETMPTPNRDSPTPAIPTYSWPPDPNPISAAVPSIPVIDANPAAGSWRYSAKSNGKKMKRKRSITPPASSPQPQPTPCKGTVDDGLAILQLLCTSHILKLHIYDLLCERDAFGHTPFMSAIYNRAYPAALILLRQSKAIARNHCRMQEGGELEGQASKKYDCSDPTYRDILMSMIYPECCEPDQNPMYVLCANDTCSFTWTGDQHINQDIFECWTCGLTGTLCCCSECARVCHKGHDCKLKQTSPTAYCDCWEKCSCRSLVAGDSSARMQLLEKLLKGTKLVDLPNGHGETILQFLAQTVARQTVEQRQHRTRSGASGTLRGNRSAKTTIAGVEYDAPQHNLQPPTFCREAFLMLLRDWTSLRSTVMSSCPGHMDQRCASSILELASSGRSSPLLLPEEEQCLASQTGTSRLDAFVLCMLVKCNTEYLDLLLETFIDHLQKMNGKDDDKETLQVIHRFMRSVVRVFVVLSIETQPGKQTGRNMVHSQPLKRAQRTFMALLPMAVKELCETATTLIAPVRTGVARPTSPFPLLPSSTEAVQSCETAFSRLPFPPRSMSRGKKDREQTGRLTPFSAETPSSQTVSHPLSRGNYGRRGISRRRTQNLGSTRVGSSLSTQRHNAENPDAGNDQYEYRLPRIYAPLSDDEEEEEDAEEDEWDVGGENQEETENNNQEETPEPNLQSEREEGDVARESAQENQEPEPDEIQQEENHNNEVEDGEENSQEVVSEGDLDMEDEDEDGEGDGGDEDAGPGGEEENPPDGEESDMDLTLLVGSEADSDAESSSSRREQTESRTNRILFLDEDENISEDIGEDEDDEENDDDDHDSYNVRRQTDDEGATATDVDEEGDSTSEDGSDAAEDRNEEDEEEEEGASHSDWVELPLERAPTRSQRSRAAQSPHSMQWALGSSRTDLVRPGSNTAGSRQGGPGSSSVASNLIYIDPSSLRRGSNLGVNSSATPGGSASGDSGRNGSASNTHSVSTTNAQLARGFAICIREMSGLLATVQRGDYLVSTPLNTVMELKYEDIEELKDYVSRSLHSTWKWLLSVVDSTESHLRYGQVLSLASNPNHVDHPRYKGPGKSQNRATRGTQGEIYRRGTVGGPGTAARSSLSFMVRMAKESAVDSSAARQDFLSYILSLMRSYSSEHADFLPVLGISSLRHVAYVLDAFIYFLRETSLDESAVNKRMKAGAATDSEYKFGLSLNLGYDNTDDEDEEDADGPNDDQDPVNDELFSLADSDVLVDNIISTSWAQAQEESDPGGAHTQPLKSYFKRSDSMSFLGCIDPDPFMEPLEKSLPLADKPHLLTPNARKEELFGRPRQKLEAEEVLDADDEASPKSVDKEVQTEPMEAAESIDRKDAAADDGVVEKGTEVETKQEETEPMDTTAGGNQENATATEKPEQVQVPASHIPVVTNTVIVSTGNTETERKKRKRAASTKHQFSRMSVGSLLGRSRLTLELFTRVFLDDVGAEPKSIFQELGGFEVRESKFRKEMEKLRNSQSVDLQLNVEREPHRLITQTFKQLNQHFRRRSNCSSSPSQPLAVQRVSLS